MSHLGTFNIVYAIFCIGTFVTLALATLLRRRPAYVPQRMLLGFLISAVLGCAVVAKVLESMWGLPA